MAEETGPSKAARLSAQAGAAGGGISAAPVEVNLAGLAMLPNAAGLHHPHQTRDFDSPGDRFRREIPFTSFLGFGEDNRVDITPTPMVIERLYVRMRISATTASGNSSFEPTWTWISESGARLQYMNSTIYTQSSTATAAQQYYNQENDTHNWTKLIQTDDDVVAERLFTGSAEEYHWLNLDPMAMAIMKNAGPTNAWSSSTMSIVVPLRPFTEVVANSADAATTLDEFHEMTLVMIGHRETARNMSIISSYLGLEGIRIEYEYPVHRFQRVANGDTSTVINLNDVAGAVSGFFLMIRREAGLLPAATPQNRNNSHWFQGWQTVADTITIGTTTDPFRVFGRAIPIISAQLTDTWSYNSGPVVLKPRVAVVGTAVASSVSSGTGTAATLNPPIIDRPSIISYAAAENQSMGLDFGVKSGHIVVRYDFRVEINHTDPGANLRLDLDLFYQRRLILRYDGHLITNA